MTHPLDGPRLKVACAIGQVEALRDFAESFVHQTDYRVVRAEFNPKTGKYVHRVLIDLLPPLDIGITIGHCAHDLRSALDGLVWQLALKNPRVHTPARQTGFPIFLAGRPKRCRRGRNRCKAKGFHLNCLGLDMLQDLLPEHKAAIEFLQPYKRGRGGKSNRLHLLSEINNADKHRLIQVTGVRPMGLGWMGPPGSDVQLTGFRVLEDGAEVGQAPPDVDMNIRIMPHIAFAEGCQAVFGRPVWPLLGEIAEHVSEIIEGFAPEFG